MKPSDKKQILVAIRVIGILLTIEAGFMLSSLVPAFYYAEGDAPAILTAGLITLSVGLACYLSCRKVRENINRRLGIFIVASIWIIMTVFGTLPFLLGGYIKDISSAVFETVSGFTTTGATNLPEDRKSTRLNSSH